MEEGGGAHTPAAGSPSARFSSWLPRWNSSSSLIGRGAIASGEDGQRDPKEDAGAERPGAGGRRISLGDTFHELGNQVRLFIDDDSEFTGSSATSEEEGEGGEDRKEKGRGVGIEASNGDGEGDVLSEEEGVQKFQAGGIGGAVEVLP